MSLAHLDNRINILSVNLEELSLCIFVLLQGRGQQQKKLGGIFHRGEVPPIRVENKLFHKKIGILNKSNPNSDKPRELKFQLDTLQGVGQATKTSFTNDQHLIIYAKKFSRISSISNYISNITLPLLKLSVVSYNILKNKQMELN